jgi:hypothetical protein
VRGELHVGTELALPSHPENLSETVTQRSYRFQTGTALKQESLQCESVWAARKYSAAKRQYPAGVEREGSNVMAPNDELERPTAAVYLATRAHTVSRARDALLRIVTVRSKRWLDDLPINIFSVPDLKDRDLAMGIVD